ncbi:MAG: general secretion pathway protein GspB [Nitrospirae bacterium]|nr:general secretion pathway protein GspB [Nitrospirota bacterium]
MSYILDALKKSEQKRRQGTVPDLLTVHESPGEKPRKQPWGTYVVVSLLLVGGLVSVWLYKVRPGVTLSAQVQVPAAPPQPVQVAVPVQTPATAAVVQPVQRETVPPVAARVPVRETERIVEAREPRTPSKQTVMKESELPSAIQQELPRIDIAAHFYDADPAARIVSMRGNVLHEGQYVAAGLKLEKITPEGVILNYKDYRFFRPAF